MCYTLIVQEGAALHTEIFNGVYSLYRGMIAATNIAILISAVITTKHVLLLLLPLFVTSVPPTPFWFFSDFHLSAGLATLISSLLVLHPMKERFKRFAQHFANSVYRSFYVWVKRQSH